MAKPSKGLSYLIKYSECITKINNPPYLQFEFFRWYTLYLRNESAVNPDCDGKKLIQFHENHTTGKINCHCSMNLFMRYTNQIF